MSRPHFLQPVLRGSGAWGLRVERSGHWLATHAELAGQSDSRRRGLLGRDGLAPGHALVIAPCQGVHTFGMRFDIDIVGIDRRGIVRKIRQAVPRRRVVLALPAFAIVELAAGSCAASGLMPGDRITAGWTQEGPTEQ